MEEKTSYKVICGSPPTWKVKRLMMMMMVVVVVVMMLRLCDILKCCMFVRFLFTYHAGRASHLLNSFSLGIRLLIVCRGNKVMFFLPTPFTFMCGPGDNDGR